MFKASFRYIIYKKSTTHAQYRNYCCAMEVTMYHIIRNVLILKDGT